MKKICILLLLLILSAQTFEQADYLSNVDSAKKVMQSLNEDTTKANLLHKIVQFYKLSNTDSTLAYTMQEYDLAQKLNYAKGWAIVYNDLSFYNYILGNGAQTLKYAYKMLPFAEQLKDRSILGHCYSAIAIGYSLLHNYQEQLQWQKKALAAVASSSDSAGQMHNLGLAYLDANLPDSALLSFQQSYRIGDSLNDKTSTIFPLFGLAKVSFILGRPEDGKMYCRQLIYQANSTGNNVFLGSAYYILAEQYLKENKKDSSLYFSRRAAEIFKLFNARNDLIGSDTSLVRVFKLNHQWDSAFKYEEQIMQVKDSIEAENNRSQLQSIAFEQKMQEKEKTDAVEKAKEALRNQVIFFSLIAALLVFGVIAFILYKNNFQKQRAKTKIENAYAELKSTQAQLIQQEKMASLGELTAGIAHEIQNPLNFVNNFSEVNKEMIVEMKEEIDKGNYDEVKSIANDLEENQEKINHHGKRADAIVKGMLQHSKTSTGIKEPTNINKLADEYLRLAYHGLRAKDKDFNVDIQTDFDESIGKINIIPQDIGRVLLNLFNNGFYAVNEKKQKLDGTFDPVVLVSTKKENGSIILKVNDNGNGIPKNIVDKIFQPFFTTKPTGQGTGLGLSLSYDIIKAHGGEIKVETKEGEGSEFVIQLPVG